MKARDYGRHDANKAMLRLRKPSRREARIQIIFDRSDTIRRLTGRSLLGSCLLRRLERSNCGVLQRMSRNRPFHHEVLKPFLGATICLAGTPFHFPFWIAHHGYCVVSFAKSMDVAWPRLLQAMLSAIVDFLCHLD